MQQTPLPFNGVPFSYNVEFLRIIDKEKVTNRCTLLFFHRTDDSTYYESPEGTRGKIATANLLIENPLSQMVYRFLELGNSFFRLQFVPSV